MVGVIFFGAGILLGCLLCKGLNGREKATVGVVSLMLACLSGWVSPPECIGFFFACAAGCMIMFGIFNVDVQVPQRKH